MADTTALQSLITSQGLTAEAAMAKYGIDQSMVDQLRQQGVNFSATAAPGASSQTAAASLWNAEAPGTQTIYNPDGSVASVNRGQPITSGWTPYIAPDGTRGMNDWANRMFAAAGTPVAASASGSQYGAPGQPGDPNAATPTPAPAPAPGTYTAQPYTPPVGSGSGSGGAVTPRVPKVPKAPKPPRDGGGGGTVGGVTPAPAPGIIPSPVITTPNPAAPSPGATAPTPIGTNGGYSGNNYTPTVAPAPPPGGTVIPANGLMDAVTVPNAAQAKVGDIGVSTAATAAPVSSSTATATGYSSQDGAASTWAPDSKSTVQGQIKDIIAEGSPLMDMAQTRALQRANASGLRNSSMAVQAGQAALYDSAMPIATQDANMFAQAGQFNAQNKTQVSMANAAARNAAEQFKAQTATDVSKFNADALLKAGAINQEQANRMAQFNASEVNKSVMFELQNDADIQKFNASESNALLKLGMDSQTKMSLAQIEANYKTLMQTSASSAEVYKTLIGNMGSILGNKDMDAAAKSLAIQNLVGALNGALGVVGEIANLDLPELDFSDLPASTVTPAPTPAPGAGPVPGTVDGGQDANGSVAGGTAGDGVGNNANGDAAGVGAGPM